VKFHAAAARATLTALTAGPLGLEAVRAAVDAEGFDDALDCLTLAGIVQPVEGGADAVPRLRRLHAAIEARGPAFQRIADWFRRMLAFANAPDM